MIWTSNFNLSKEKEIQKYLYEEKCHFFWHKKTEWCFRGKKKQEQNKINYLSINFNIASRYLSKSGGKYVCYNQEIWMHSYKFIQVFTS